VPVPGGIGKPETLECAVFDELALLDDDVVVPELPLVVPEPPLDDEVVVLPVPMPLLVVTLAADEDVVLAVLVEVGALEPEPQEAAESAANALHAPSTPRIKQVDELCIVRLPPKNRR
jgi:hypothetical protein